MTGTITKVEFQNPHIDSYIDVKQADGTLILADGRRVFRFSGAGEPGTNP